MWNKKFKLNPLPMNMPEFDSWAARIIKEADLPTKNIETQRFALASMILQTAPADFYRPDEYYIGLLKKAASDQLACQVIEDLKAKRAEETARNKEVTTTKDSSLHVVKDKA